MTREKLQELLDNGSITQEEFDALIQTVKDPDPEPTPDPEPNPDPEPLDYDKLERLLQAKLDKAMAKERKEKAELKRQLERERKARLTDDELKQIEIEEKENALAEREKALKDRENREYAQKALREAGLDDGSETAYLLADFVMGEDETETNEKVKTFKELFDKAVTAAVDKRFKESGYTPKKSNSLNNGVNPYTKEQFSLTEQMRLEVENPELAKQLRSVANTI